MCITLSVILKIENSAIFEVLNSYNFSFMPHQKKSLHIFFGKIIRIISMTLFAVNILQAQQIDILLKGGHVIDPKNKIDEQMDVAIANGKIFQVAKDISAKNAKQVIDVSGLYVTPGIIDMHVHVFNGTDVDAYIANALTSLPPVVFTFRAGVTSVVDAGSSGWRNFRQFKKQTIDKAQTRVLAFLNIVGNGMVGRLEEQDISDMNPQQTAYMIKKLFPDIIVGIKAAHYWGDFTQVDHAVEAGKLANVPVMVDFGEHEPPNSIEALFMQKLEAELTIRAGKIVWDLNGSSAPLWQEELQKK